MMNSIDAMGQRLAFDPQFSQNISKNQSESESLQQVAEQFETLFLQMVLKNMRSASDALTGDEDMFSSNQQLMFRDMYDSQMAQAMANNSKTGLAEQIVQQFSADHPQNTENKLKPAANPVAESLYQDYGTAALTQPLQVPLRHSESTE
jgi:peptidoglycan hydrolase FlgJ